MGPHSRGGACAPGTRPPRASRRARTQAARDFDQHSMSWCGCCYLVAAVQCVEDRGSTSRPRAARPRRAAAAATAAGAPLAAARARPLRRARRRAGVERVPAAASRCTCSAAWPRGAARSSRPRRPPVARPPAHARRDGALRRGPARGAPAPPRARRGARGAPRARARRARGERGDAQERRRARRRRRPRAARAHHAVAVVGWTTDAAAGPCWVVRNSWGARRGARALPSDLGCVSHQGNACEVEWEPWSGDPRDPGLPAAARVDSRRSARRRRRRGWRPTSRPRERGGTGGGRGNGETHGVPSLSAEPEVLPYEVRHVGDARVRVYGVYSPSRGHYPRRHVSGVP